jgi:hypothetical protein
MQSHAEEGVGLGAVLGAGDGWLKEGVITIEGKGDGLCGETDTAGVVPDLPLSISRLAKADFTGVINQSPSTVKRAQNGKLQNTVYFSRCRVGLTRIRSSI